MWVALSLLLLLLSAHVGYGQTGPPACTHYASPTGTGTTCTPVTPCLVSTWTSSSTLAVGGNTLCLNDGNYQRSAGGNVDPTDTFAGTAGNPITVRALNDGQVTIDAQAGFGVFLNDGNDYWHIWGVNCKNGGEACMRSKGTGNRFFRVVAYNGTSGQADSLGISMSGSGTDQLCVDCAAFGTNMRKIYEFSQTTAVGQDMLGSGCRRCWGEWNDHPEGVSNPNVTYQVGYRSRGQIWENVIGTWRQIGTVGDSESILRAFYDCQASSMVANLKVLGSLFYMLNGNTTQLTNLVSGDCASNTTFKDVASVVQSNFTLIQPFIFRNSSSATAEVNNVCENCLSVHAGTVSVNSAGSGFTLVNFMEGTSVLAATSGVSPFVALPGLCSRYEGGVLTSQPLWSDDGKWPMNQRIIDARIAAGYPSVDVTATVEGLLGTIPDNCKGIVGQRNKIAVQY